MAQRLELQRRLGLRLLGHFRFVLLLLGLAMLVGSLGFMLIEDYPPVDAVYMTLITISTVGFGEIHPLSAAGRIFTSVLILTNVSIFLYALSSFSSFFLDGHGRKIMNEVRMQHHIERLNNHVVLCGFGRNGRQVALEMVQAGESLVLVEKSEPLAEEARELLPQALVVQGDATDDDTLQRANLATAKVLVTTLPDDASNVFVVLTAREANPHLRIVARASQEASEAKLMRAGANHVVMPEKIAGSHMASMAIKPDATAILGLIASTGKADFFLEEFPENSLLHSLRGKGLSHLVARADAPIHVIGVKCFDGDFVVNPGADYVPPPESKLIVLGSRAALTHTQNNWLQPA